MLKFQKGLNDLLSIKDLYQKYPRVFWLGIVSLFADIAGEMLNPIIPIFLTTVLGASMSAFGWIEGLAEGTASLLKTYAGFWSDRFQRRKPFIIFGYLLSALSRPWIGAAESIYHVFGARALDRVGKGIRTAPRDALIADGVDSKNLGAVFGWHRGLDTLGAVLGPLLALGILLWVSDLRVVFFWAFIPGLISVLLVLRISEPSTRAKIASRFHFSLKDMSAEFRVFVFLWTLFCLSNSSDAFLILKMKANDMTTTSVILIYAFFNLVYALASPYLGSLSDKVGKRKTLNFGIFIFALVYLGFVFSDQWWQFLALMGIYGLFMAATEGVARAYVVDLVPANMKATGIGVLGTMTGISQILASAFAGFLWDYHGANFALLFSVFGACLFLLGQFFLLKPKLR